MNGPCVNMDLLFQILLGPGNHPKVYVPWNFVAPHEAQAQRNHSQTLNRLKDRGGLSPSELLAVLEDRDWKKMSDAEAWMMIFGHYRVFASRTHSPELRALVLAARWCAENDGECLGDHKPEQWALITALAPFSHIKEEA